MKKIILVLLMLFNCSSKDDFYFPPEWEAHSSIWLSWATFENIKGRSTEDVQLQIIKELAPYVKIDLLVQSQDEIDKIKKQMLAEKIPSTQLQFHIMPHEDIWMRDMGAIFLKNRKTKELKVADFKFNQWGYSKELTLDDKIDSQIAAKLNLKTVSTNLISEGGGWETNGNGVIMTTESVMLQRNPNLSKKEIEEEFKKTLNIKKVIWFKEGVPEDRHSTLGKLPGGYFTPVTTGGHVDEFVRFVKDDTILLAEIKESEVGSDLILKEGRRILEETYQVLLKETDSNGKPFKIIRLPSPELMFETIQSGDGVFTFLQELKFKDGSKLDSTKKEKIILATSYMNFLVTNGVVLMQKYWKAGRSEIIKAKDEEARKILQEIFPDRKIIGIDAENLNIGGGGIHCITQQMP